MTEIVERLREWRSSVTALSDDRYRMIGEAADEIERLRSKLDKAVTALEKIAKPALGGKTQQGIARAALAEIGETGEGKWPDEQPGGPPA